MDDRTKLAIERAHDADNWRLTVEFGEGFLLIDEGRFELVARHFNTLVYFMPPGRDQLAWWLAEEAVSSDDDEREFVAELTVPQVIDVVPYVVEDWVLAASREAADYFEADEDEAHQRASTRLRSEWEQGEAHSARWKARMKARYGDILLYGFPDGAQLQRERGEENGRAVLFIGENGHPSRRVLVSPDSDHPWRYSDSGHFDEYGETLSVYDAVERAGSDNAGWVREQTMFALGETLAALRAHQDRGLTGREPAVLREVARLAGHAQELAEGLQPSLVGD